MIPAWKMALGLALAAGLLVAFAVLPAEDWLARAVGWIQEQGPAGGALYALLYAAWVVALLPAAALTMGAGLIYGPLWGVLVVWPGAMLGAALSFGLGRTLARERVAAAIAHRPRFQAVDGMIRRRGAGYLALLRLSPLMPFALLSYAMGLTSLRWRGFLAATGLGMLPGMTLYIYLGSTLGQFGALAQTQSPAQRVLYWGGLAVTLAVTLAVARAAKRAIAEEDASSAMPQGWRERA